MWMWEVPKSTTPTGAQVGRQSKSWSRLVSPPQQSWLWIRIESMSALHTKHWSKWIDQLLYLVRPGGFPPSHGCVYCWLHLRVNLEQVGCPRLWEVLHDEKTNWHQIPTCWSFSTVAMRSDAIRAMTSPECASQRAVGEAPAVPVERNTSSMLTLCTVVTSYA